MTLCEKGCECDDFQVAKGKRRQRRERALEGSQKILDGLNAQGSLNILQTIIPEGINEVETQGEWEEIELAVDTGATDSVAADSSAGILARRTADSVVADGSAGAGDVGVGGSGTGGDGTGYGQA